MKKRTVLTMILAVTIVSGFLTGCGEKKVSAKEPSTTKAEQLSITDNKSKKEEIATDSVTINVTADEGWDGDSTPAILHITSKDVENSEFYHAIHPDKDGGTGTTAVELAEGKYDIEFISPLNNDGSAYEIYEMGEKQEITVDVDFGKDMTVTCEMKQIPADQVTDEMVRDIVAKTQAAMEKGDDTLKGDAGKKVLENLAQNVAHSPNASEETKKQAQAVKEETKVEDIQATKDNAQNAETNGTTNGGSASEESSGSAVQNHTAQDNTTQNNTTQDNTVQNNTTQNNTTQGNTVQDNTVQDNTVKGDTQVSTSQPQVPAQNTTAQGKPVQGTPVQEAPAHVHTWVDHVATKQEWVPNMVTVPDYETQDRLVTVCNCGAEFDFELDQAAFEDHVMAHLLAGEDDGYWQDHRTTTVQVGSHQEDQGYYKDVSYVDYQYCSGCGAHK